MRIIKRFRYDRGDNAYHITVFDKTVERHSYRIICNDADSRFHGVTDLSTMEGVTLVVAEILSHADACEEVAA